MDLVETALHHQVSKAIADFLFACGWKFPCGSALWESRGFSSSKTRTRWWIRDLGQEAIVPSWQRKLPEKTWELWPNWDPQHGSVQADVWIRGSRKSFIKYTGHPAWELQVIVSLNSHLEHWSQRWTPGCLSWTWSWTTKDLRSGWPWIKSPCANYEMWNQLLILNLTFLHCEWRYM